MMNSRDRHSWSVCVSSDDILNFIVYIGCSYGLIDEKKYAGKEILWPPKFLNTEADSEQWEKWFEEIVRIKAEKIKGGRPNTAYEEYMPPEFSSVGCPVLKECCRNSWPKFYEWWSMMAGGRNATNFVEQLGSGKIGEYVNEVERKLGREVKPFSLNIDLVYTGINEVMDINDQFVIAPLNPIITLDKAWWIKKLYEIG